MKKTTMLKTGVRLARKHPKATLSVASFAARHWRGIARSVKVGRVTSQGIRAARATAAAAPARSEVVKGDLHAAIGALADSVERIRRVGVERAIADRKVAKLIDRTVDHASSAWGHSRKKKTSHRKRSVAAATAALGLVAGAYGGLKHRQGDRD